MIIDGRIIPNFQTHKIVGQNVYELHFFNKEVKLEVFDIPLEYGGKLATHKKDFFEDGTRIERQLFPFDLLPIDVKKQVIIAIGYITCNGTPMQNDQHIYQN